MPIISALLVLLPARFVLCLADELLQLCKEEWSVLSKYLTNLRNFRSQPASSTMHGPSAHEKHVDLLTEDRQPASQCMCALKSISL